MNDFPNKETQFSSENQPKKNGRPKGLRNRSTIAKEIFKMTVKYPEEVLTALKEMYPDLTNNVTIEEAMAIMQASKAIQDKDTAAYKALMDSRYGMPQQQVENTNIDKKDVDLSQLTDKELAEYKKLIEKIERNE